MAQETRTPGLSQVVMLAAGAIIVAGLYFAQDVLVPLALSVLLAFLLAPLVKRVERLHLSRVPAVLVVVALSSCLIVGLGYVVTSQLVGLAYKLPEYRDNIRHKVQALRGSSPSSLSRVAETIQEIKQELTTQPATSSAPASPAIANHLEEVITRPPGMPVPLEQPLPQPVDRTRPLPVEVIQPTSVIQTARDTLGYLAGPLGTAAIVIVLVIFMLIEREDLRDRFISLVGRGRIHITTIALDDAGSRISKYLLMQLVVNATYGIPVGVALYFIGVPSALLWGLLATLLRYLPYVGPWIAASLPTMLSLAVFDDWWHVSLVVGVFIVLELISNNVLEPMLYGSSTGMSAVAVLIAAVFWTWLWGPVGLFLATPMTACIVVMGKYIPQMEFLAVLLGDQQVFTPETRFYQRLLAMDQEEAEDLMEEYLEKGSLLQAYDRFLLPALHLAEQDRHRDRIDTQRHDFIFSTVRDMVGELGESKIERERQETIESMRAIAESPTPVVKEEKNGEAARDAAAEPEAMHIVPDGFRVLCLPARDEADEIAAMMFSQVLEAKGVDAEHLSTASLKSEMIEAIRTIAPRVVCISALPPGALTHARYICKRLKSIDATEVIVGMWDTRANLDQVRDRLTCAGATHVVSRFEDAVELIQRFSQRELSQPSRTPGK